MNETITYCDVDHKQVEDRSRLCRRCEGQIHTWLTKIPDLYALLPTFIEHGSTEANPDSKATKRSEVAAPMRLEIIDLLDTRYGRKWLGTAATTDRRGVVGTLMAHVDRVRDERNLTHAPKPTVVGACTFLDRHRLWIAEQDWAGDLHAELKDTHRSLSDATGNYRRPPVGHCHIDNGDGRCNGPLFASTYGGVRCAKCSAIWDANHLRQLGLAQAEAQESPA